VAYVTLHVGLSTFRPIRAEDVDKHEMYPEWCEVPPSTAEAVNATHAAGRRVIAIGTTTARTLEGSIGPDGQLHAYRGETKIFIKPGFSFRALDALVTNFHLPGSTLLLLVCAFGGKEAVLRAYNEAVREGYRFLSFGDAMLIG
jgi:S-adenosylmethionine:tRNA ribosyltransferase-isomerase